MNILPKLIDGGKDPREAQGCRVMAKNEVSHDCAIPGSPDQLGIAPDQRGDLPTQKGRGVGQGESGIVLSLYGRRDGHGSIPRENCVER